MAKTEDISSKIQLLQEKLAKENETRDSVMSQSFVPSKRPNNLSSELKISCVVLKYIFFD